MSGNLYLVSTPIGNLDDLTLRALKTLSTVEVIFAESVERTKKLLSHFNIETKILSYNKDNERRKVKSIIKLLEESKNVALVTDAGTPCISDPGFYLLSKLDKDINIIPIPGASSLSCALSVSRIPMNSFIFLGFLPKNESERRNKLTEVSSTQFPLCLFESKYRLLKLLREIQEIYGDDTQVGIFKEMTKLHESIIHESVVKLIEDYETLKPKGEFVVIVSPKSASSKVISYDLVAQHLISKNFSNKDIVDIIKIITKDSKKEIYKNVLSIRQNN